MLDKLTLIISIIGGLNLGSMGIFRYDFISAVCGGSSTVGARIIYTIIG